MIPFATFRPELARSETRAIVVPEGDPALPAGTYAFLELYCGGPGCRCDNVMLNVCGAGGAHLATINHSLTPGGFSDVDMADSFLDPLNRQSRWSEAILALFLREVLDRDYADLLRRHRAMVMEVVNGKRRPGLRWQDPARAKRRKWAGPTRWTLRPPPPGEGRRREGPSPPRPEPGTGGPA